MKQLDPELQERLEKLISSMGYELVGCEKLAQGRGFLFRIYIDRPNGVTVDDCSLVSKQVSAMFDVMDIFHDKYTLEVSSPGIDRPLFTLDHFRKYIGNLVKVRLVVPVGNTRQLKGRLQQVEGDELTLKLETGEMIKVAFDNLDKAHLINELM